MESTTRSGKRLRLDDAVPQVERQSLSSSTASPPAPARVPAAVAAAAAAVPPAAAAPASAPSAALPLPPTAQGILGKCVCEIKLIIHVLYSY